MEPPVLPYVCDIHSIYIVNMVYWINSKLIQLTSGITICEFMMSYIVQMKIFLVLVQCLCFPFFFPQWTKHIHVIVDHNSHNQTIFLKSGIKKRKLIIHIELCSYKKSIICSSAKLTNNYTIYSIYCCSDFKHQNKIYFKMEEFFSLMMVMMPNL